MAVELKSSEELLIEELRKLPEEKVNEVMDFVAFLQQREANEGIITSHIAKLSEKSFARIWDNEKDAVYDNL